MTLRWKGNAAATLAIPCPQCGKEQPVLVSELRMDPQLTCPDGPHVPRRRW